MLEFYLENKILYGLGAELIAAIYAIVVLSSGNATAKPLRIFAYYVVGIFIVDLFGGYVIYAYFNDYQTLSFIKDTPFVMNHWWYNITQFLSFLIFTYVVGSGLKNRNIIRILQIAALCFCVFAFLRFFWLGDFFNRRDIGMEMAGTGLLLLSSGFYFMELLRSDRILNFAYYFRFYVAIGASVFYLIVIPIEIYSSYFTVQNPEFVKFHATILRYLIFFMYGLFCLGFYMNYRGKKKNITV